MQQKYHFSQPLLNFSSNVLLLKAWMWVADAERLEERDKFIYGVTSRVTLIWVGLVTNYYFKHPSLTLKVKVSQTVKIKLSLLRHPIAIMSCFTFYFFRIYWIYLIISVYLFTGPWMVYLQMYTSKPPYWIICIIKEKEYHNWK